MAYLYNRMYRRDDVNTPWVANNPAFLDYVTTNYIATNKVTDFRKIEESDTRLSMVIGSVWESKEVFDAFCQDPVVVAEREEALAYNVTNSIFLIEEYKDGVQTYNGVTTS
jgi:hypothetical protein